MEDKLIEILSQFEVPVYRQGSMSDDDKYPETFFTFWNNESLAHSYYDDDDYSIEWNFDVNIYSSNPTTAYSMLLNARRALKQNGWTIGSYGYDVASDEATHIGRGFNALFLQILTQEEQQNENS